MAKGLTKRKAGGGGRSNGSNDAVPEHVKKNTKKTAAAAAAAAEAAPQSVLAQLAPLLLLSSVTAVVCGWVYSRYGINIFLPESSKTLSWPLARWRSVLGGGSRSVAMVGGPHRGGTTVLWEQLRRHPGVADFGSQFESGVDYSEGIFLQSVYPRFGVGEEYNHLARYDRGTKRTDGLGRYGFAGDDQVHLTDAHPTLLSDENQLALLNSWGYYWGEGALPNSDDAAQSSSSSSSSSSLFPTRVLLEKSPPNMHISRFLQALINRGLFDDFHSSDKLPNFNAFRGATTTAVKFVFISRHPIANALAHRALKECSSIPVAQLVEHWVILHEYLAADLPLLIEARRLTLEAFALDPGNHLLTLWEWMLGADAVYDDKDGDKDDDKNDDKNNAAKGMVDGRGGREGRALKPWVASLVQAAEKAVRRDPNAKYRGSYCNAVSASPTTARSHRTLVELWGERVARTGFGYDLDEWPCLARTIRLAQQQEEGSEESSSSSSSSSSSGGDKSSQGD